MTITEFAILTLKQPITEPMTTSASSRPNKPTLKEFFEGAQTAQDEWAGSSRSVRGAAWFHSTSDLTTVLITAKWESIGHHYSWINSKENQDVMNQLVPYLAAASPGREMIFFHVEGSLFAETHDSEPGIGLLHQNVCFISIDLFVIQSLMRCEFETRLKQSVECLREGGFPGPVKIGWRVEELDAGERTEVVVCCGWDSTHKEGASGRFAALVGMAEQHDSFEMIKFL